MREREKEKKTFTKGKTIWEIEFNDLEKLSLTRTHTRTFFLSSFRSFSTGNAAFFAPFSFSIGIALREIHSDDGEKLERRSRIYAHTHPFKE